MQHGTVVLKTTRIEQAYIFLAFNKDKICTCMALVRMEGKGRIHQETQSLATSMIKHNSIYLPSYIFQYLDYIARYLAPLQHSLSQQPNIRQFYYPAKETPHILNQQVLKVTDHKLRMMQFLLFNKEAKFEQKKETALTHMKEESIKISEKSDGTGQKLGLNA